VEHAGKQVPRVVGHAPRVGQQRGAQPGGTDRADRVIHRDGRDGPGEHPGQQALGQHLDAVLARPAIAQPAKVRYTLSWLPTGQYAFLYCARQLGYFKQRGIELDIARGYGSMAAIQAVSTGQFEMGGAQTGANLLSIMKGLDLRLLGTQGYDATLGVLAPEKGPVKTPKELERRQIRGSAARQ